MTPMFILSVMLCYFAVLLAVAIYTSRDASNAAFFIGHKKSPWYVVAFGMIGASLSGVTFISVPGAVGDPNNVNTAFSYLQLAMGYLVGYAVVALVLMPTYYAMQLTSIYTYLEQRFGVFSYKTGAGYFLLSRTIGSAFRLYLVALVLQRFLFDPLGVPFFYNALSMLFMIWLYTIRGGIKSIIWTDTVQTTFMLLSVISITYGMGSELGWGVGDVWRNIQDSQYSQVFFWDWQKNNYFWKQFLSGVFIAITMTGLDQDLMQKNNSCKNIGEAQLNMFVFSGVYFVVIFLFLSLGAMLYLYANAKGIVLPARTDLLFPTLAFEYFPTYIGVFFLIGLTAACYASADSAITSLTTSFCIDFLNFEKRQDVPPQQLQRTRYWVHIGFSVVLLLVVLLFKEINNEAVINEIFRLAGYTYGPLLGLYSFGFLLKGFRPIDRFVPLVCVVSPVLCYFLNVYMSKHGFQIGFALLIINGAITFLGLLLLSLLNERKEGV